MYTFLCCNNSLFCDAVDLCSLEIKLFLNDSAVEFNILVSHVKLLLKQVHQGENDEVTEVADHPVVK